MSQKVNCTNRLIDELAMTHYRNICVILQFKIFIYLSDGLRRTLVLESRTCAFGESTDCCPLLMTMRQVWRFFVKEELDGYNIDNEVIKYIANIKSNIRELEGSLHKRSSLSA